MRHTSPERKRIPTIKTEPEDNTNRRSRQRWDDNSSVKSWMDNINDEDERPKQTKAYAAVDEVMTNTGCKDKRLRASLKDIFMQSVMGMGGITSLLDRTNIPDKMKRTLWLEIKNQALALGMTVNKPREY